MPRNAKENIHRLIGEKSEYTFIADDFASFDQNIEKGKAATALWSGCSYPKTAINIIKQMDSPKGPWWLDHNNPEEENDIVSILRKAHFLKTIPVVHDCILHGNRTINVICKGNIVVSASDDDYNKQIKQALIDLMYSEDAEKEKSFKSLLNLSVDDDTDNKTYEILLLSFSDRIWVEGISHRRLCPAIVIHQNTFERYHQPIND